MSGLFTVTVEEARGTIAVPTDLDRTAIVLGCSSAGSGLSNFFLSGESAQASVGYGDASDTLCQIIEQLDASQKFPAALYTTPDNGTVGTYGTIDLAGVTGTCVPAVDDSLEPYGTDELKVLVVAGGTVGTTGITYKLSRDAGRHYGNTIALGTATSIAVSNAGSGFVLDPPSAGLVALVNDIRTDLIAHFALTAGGVHGGADGTSGAGIGSAATDVASAVTLINQCRAAYELHRVLTSGSVHGAADNTNAVSAPAATNGQTAVTLANEIKADYNAHRILTAGSVHGLADGTNVVTAADAAHGTLVAGDYFTVRTYAPAPSTSDVTTAIAALKVNAVDFALLVCAFPVDATMAAILTAGRAELAEVGKLVTILAPTRIPDAETSETDAAWNTSIAADFAAFEDNTVQVRAAYGYITDAMTGNQYLRTDMAQWAADVVRVARSAWPNAPADTLDGMRNVTLVNSAGTLIGHDEGPMGSSTGLSNPTIGNRFSCVQRLGIASVRNAVYATAPWVMYAPGDTIQTLMQRRLANACERVAVNAGVPQLGARLFYVSTGATSGTLTAQSLRAVQSAIFAAVSSAFSTEFDNAQDADLNTGLVQVNPTVVVAPGKLLSVEVTVAPDIGGYVQNLTFTLAIQQ